jgi:hypothetical protein
MIRVVEPGVFEVLVGSSSEDIRMADEFLVVEKIIDKQSIPD